MSRRPFARLRFSKSAVRLCSARALNGVMFGTIISSKGV